MSGFRLHLGVPGMAFPLASSPFASNRSDENAAFEGTTGEVRPSGFPHGYWHTPCKRLEVGQSSTEVSDRSSPPT